MGRIATLNDIFIFIVKYIFNYLFAIYLIVMATMEKNIIHSLFYSVSAVVSFSKVIFHAIVLPKAYRYYSTHPQETIPMHVF